MATFVQRAQAIADALLNRTATAAEVNRLGRAMAHSAMKLAEYDAATNTGKAQILVVTVRQRLIAHIKIFEAEDAVATARATAESDAETAFSDTP